VVVVSRAKINYNYSHRRVAVSIRIIITQLTRRKTRHRIRLQRVRQVVGCQRRRRRPFQQRCRNDCTFRIYRLDLEIPIYGLCSGYAKQSDSIKKKEKRKKAEQIEKTPNRLFFKFKSFNFWYYLNNFELNCGQL
jgi:hypothetical protein